VYAVIVILLSACMLMLSYVIIVSCTVAHACIERVNEYFYILKSGCVSELYLSAS